MKLRVFLWGLLLPVVGFAHLSAVDYVTLSIDNQSLHRLTCQPGNVSHGELSMPATLVLDPNESVKRGMITAKMKHNKAKGTLACLVANDEQHTFTLFYDYEASQTHRVSGHLKLVGKVQIPASMRIRVIERNAYNSFGGVRSKPLIHFIVSERKQQ